MNKDRKQDDQLSQQQATPHEKGQKHESPFKEASTPTTETPEEEAAAEQQRKEALTERD
jgi:hypothetical protein